MKTLLRILALWGVLAILCWPMVDAVESGTMQVLAVCGMFVLPPLAVWLTVRVAATLSGPWYGRVAFWTVTASGWLAALLLAQHHYESPVPEHRANLSLALGLFTLTILWLAIKTRSFPPWRVFGEAAAGLAILALAVGAIAWRYDATTRRIVAQAEARWTEIGLPMAEFEKTLAPGRENEGSKVFRQVLRDQVGTHFYKDGTAAAEHEPAIVRSEAVETLCIRAANITALPKADDFAFIEPDSAYLADRKKRVKFGDDAPKLSAPTAAEIEAASQALDADYRRILEEEPPTWAYDPQDTYLISVPNFLGVRKFAQLASADALRRFANGDQEGAARAIAAGLRIGERMRDNPTLISLMIHVAVESLLKAREVRLPATDDGLPSIARDAAVLRAEFLRRVQIESWAQLRTIDNANPDQTIFTIEVPCLPQWVRRGANRRLLQRQLARAALNGAEHAAIFQSPGTLALPDLGQGLHDAVSARYPTAVEPNWMRAAMRIEATLLLREQTELLRDARARLAAGRPVEVRDSVVRPGLRWELIADTERNSVATRLVGAPEWLMAVAPPAFWELPLDGSVAWQFHTPDRTAGVR